MRRALGVLVLLAACRGETGHQVEQATVEPSTTTSTTARLSPEDAYLDDLHEVIDFNSTEWGDAVTDLVGTVCDSLDAFSTEAMLEDDAESDTPQSDAAISEMGSDLVLSTAVTEATGRNITESEMASILALGAEHFCPEHSETVTNYLASRGLTP